MRRGLFFGFLALLFFMVLGVFGYSILEHWNLIDSLYMTVMVLTTIGFSEVHKLSLGGKIFTMIFSLIGFGIFAGLISIFSSSIMENYLRSDRRREKMLKKIENIKDHFIVCGAGKIGRHVIRSLVEMKKAFVMIDTEEKYIESILKENTAKNFIQSDYLFLQGDATREEILRQAGIERAAGLITCLPEDSQNLFICLTAKNVNPKIRISTQVLEEVNMDKFYMIGVDEVVSSDFVIGKRLSSSLTQPNVSSFLEQTSFLGENQAFFVGDVVIGENSSIIGKTLKTSQIYANTGLLIFAMKRGDEGFYEFNPNSDAVLQKGDVLITFGSGEDLAKLEKYVNPKPKKSFFSTLMGS